MTIVGRLTRNATINELKDGREVLNFSLAVNEYYKAKNGEAAEHTTYYNCSYWINPKMESNLKKGTLVELNGRVYVTAYSDADGNAKASLNCHVNSIKIHSWSRELSVAALSTQKPVQDETAEDLPF